MVGLFLVSKAKRQDKPNVRNTAAFVGRSDEQAVCELKPGVVGVTWCSGCCPVACLVAAGLPKGFIAMRVYCAG